VKLDRNELVTMLLDHGANVNVVDGKSGHSPLYMAAQLNRMNTASLLLQRGASVQLGSYYGCTPIQAASARAHHGMVKLLLQNGAIETSSSDKVRRHGQR
jgi:ankyrin repeat protein